MPCRQPLGTCPLLRDGGRSLPFRDDPHDHSFPTMHSFSLSYDQPEAESFLSMSKALHVLHRIDVNSVRPLWRRERENTEKLLRPGDLFVGVKYREEHILHLLLRSKNKNNGWQIVHMAQVVVDKYGILREMRCMLQPARNNDPVSITVKDGVLGIILRKRERRISEGPTILEVR